MASTIREEYGLVPPTDDPVFKSIFGREESVKALTTLIDSIFRKLGIEKLNKEEEMHIECESALITGTISCKTPRLDVKLITPTRRIDVEAQNYQDFIMNRMIYYAAALMTTGVEKGSTYDKIPQTVIIMLYACGEVLPGNEYLGLAQTCWVNTGEVASDRQLFVLVDLTRFKKLHPTIDDEILNDEAAAVLYYLSNGYQREEDQVALETAFPGIVEFSRLYNMSLDDPETHRTYRAVFEAELEYNTRMSIAETKGEARGLEKGLEKGIAEGREKGLAEGREKGLAEGREKGLAEGREKGLAEGRAEMLDQLRALGVDESILSQVSVSA